MNEKFIPWYCSACGRMWGLVIEGGRPGDPPEHQKPNGEDCKLGLTINSITLDEAVKYDKEWVKEDV